MTKEYIFSLQGAQFDAFGEALERDVELLRSGVLCINDVVSKYCLQVSTYDANTFFVPKWGWCVTSDSGQWELYY